MLSDFRFVFGAIMATAVLSVATFGVVMSLRLAREAQVTPIDSSRPLAYTNSGEWNRFYDSTGLRPEGRAQGSDASIHDVAPATNERPGPPLVIVPDGVNAGPGPASVPVGPNVGRPAEEAASVPDPAPAPDSDPVRTASVPVEPADVTSETNAIVADTATPIATPDEHAVVPAPGAPAAEVRIAAIAPDRQVTPGIAAGNDPVSAAAQPLMPPAPASEPEAAPSPDLVVATADPAAPATSELPSPTLATALDPTIEATGTIRAPVDTVEAPTGSGLRLANISPAPEDPAAASGPAGELPTAAPTPPLGKPAARARHLGVPRVTRSEAPNRRHAKNATPQIRVTSRRMASPRPVVEEPHASTGYSIMVPRATYPAQARPQRRPVQASSMSNYQD